MFVEGFIQMAELQSVLLIYLVVGFICNKVGIITHENQQKFIDLITNVLMACMVFNSFKGITIGMLSSAFSVLMISILICLVSWVLGRVLYRRFPENEQRPLRYATLISNAGFAGLPLAESTFGEEGLLYASIYLIPIRVFIWSAGITMLSGEKVPFPELVRKLATNPCIIAVFLGLARGLLGIEFPAPVETALSNLSACVSPLSMIVVGAIIGNMDLRYVVTPHVLYYCAIRLVVLPLITYGLCLLIGAGEVVSGTCMLLSAMPAAATTSLLSARYGADEEFASRLVCVSTVLSLVTTPVLMLLL